ncbi:MAG: HAD family hydrolase [Oligoflexia bacterium]|nr:HAD family hydrolase [Oligoflexia bacterium]
MATIEFWPRIMLFDFDGVIVDSLEVKSEAFCDVFREEFPRAVDAIRAYTEANGGISRMVKFAYIYEQVLGMPERAKDKKHLEELGEKFSKAVVDRIISMPLNEGVLEFLEKLQENNIPMYVVSGTPHEELQLICRAKKLEHFFLGMFGSPAKKGKIIGDILREHRFEESARGDVYFIGDSINDFDGANEQKINFIGYNFVHKGNSLRYDMRNDVDLSCRVKFITHFRELVLGR